MSEADTIEAPVDEDIIPAKAPIPPMKPIQVINYIDANKLKADLSYSTNNLSDAMMQQSSMFAHYGIQLAQASKQVDTLKMVLETGEAAVYRRFRDEAAVNSEKVTEAQLEKMVARHPRVLSIKKALNEAKQVESVAKTAVEAFRHRRDMLVQHGLIAREEMKGDLYIAEKNARNDAIEAQKNRTMERLKEIRHAKNSDA